MNEKAVVDAARLAQIEGIEILSGSHPGGDADLQFCVMEAVAYVAGEEHSDSPVCASPVISAFMRRWNDDLDAAGRQRLKPYIPRLVGTISSADVEQVRGWMAADWVVRVHTAAWLRLAKLEDQAVALESLPAINATSMLISAQPSLDVARDEAAAARDAAWDAAGDAAWDAAWAAAWAAAGAAARAAARDAAWDAAGDAAWDAAWAAAGAAAWAAAGAAARAAAWDAAWDAARAAAGDAAWDAARAAAGDALKPTKESLQESAFVLLDRMLAAGDAK